MGRLSNHKQVTLYVDPVLYERVRHAAYGVLKEDIYEFVNEALIEALGRRLTSAQRAAVDVLMPSSMLSMVKKKPLRSR